jgi:hypothetical protein
VWEPLRPTLDSNPLSAAQIIRLLKAQTHPSRS